MEPEDIALRDHVIALLDKKLREGNRKLMDYRKIKIEVNPISQANGSARVRLGDTEVIAGVKLAVGEPYPDTPDSGVLITSAELSPIASRDFEPGPPRPNAIELSRVVDRAIRESEILDIAKLCIKEKEAVWLVFLDFYMINDDGNLFDACAIAAVTALKNAVFPKYDKKENKVNHRELTKEKLPLNEKNIPVRCTFSKIGEHLFVDAGIRERTVEDARLSIAIAGDDICAMQKGGDGPITEKETLKLVDEAIALSKKLKKQFKW